MEGKERMAWAERDYSRQVAFIHCTREASAYVEVASTAGRTLQQLDGSRCVLGVLSRIRW